MDDGAVDNLDLDPKKLGAAAVEWGKTIAALTTAAGIFTVLTTGLKASDLTDAARNTFTTTLTSAFIAGVVAIVLAFLAAFDNGQGYLGGRLSQLGMLVGSIIIAVIGAGLLAASSLTLFNGQEDNPNEYFVKFATDKRLVCGPLQPGENGSLTVDGTPLTDVDAYALAAEGCPTS